MDRFLDDQRHGGQLDSEGHFTVDSLGALRKTLASALPEPHYYLLQIAQGLIAAGAQDIEVAIGRQCTRFYYKDVAGVFRDLEAVRLRLGQGLTLSSPHPVDLVLTGMATAVGSEMDRAEMFSAGSLSSLEIALEQSGLKAQPQGERNPLSYIELHRSVSLGLSFAWTRIWGARDEEDDLKQRFEFAFPPLKVAGLSTTPGSRWRREVPEVGEAGRLILAEAVVVSDQEAGHRGPHFLLESQTDSVIRSLHQKFFDLQGQQLFAEPSQAEERVWSFYGTAQDTAESTVWWVRHGVAIEKSCHDLGVPGLLVVAPAAGLDLDASGYALVRNRKFEERVAKACELAKATIGSFTREELRARLGEPSVIHALALEDPGSFDPEELLRQYRWLPPASR